MWHPVWGACGARVTGCTRELTAEAPWLAERGARSAEGAARELAQDWRSRGAWPPRSVSILGRGAPRTPAAGHSDTSAATPAVSRASRAWVWVGSALSPRFGWNLGLTGRGAEGEFGLLDLSIRICPSGSVLCRGPRAVCVCVCVQRYLERARRLGRRPAPLLPLCLQ